jgi:hypothetical protein
MYTGLIWGSCGWTSGFHKIKKIVDKLSDSQVLYKASPFWNNLVGYLTTLSVASECNVYDWMINLCGEVGGMRIGMERDVPGVNWLQYCAVHYKTYSYLSPVSAATYRQCLETRVRPWDSSHKRLPCHVPSRSRSLGRRRIRVCYL